MINSQTRRPTWRAQDNALASQRGTVSFNPEGREFIKRQGRRAQRRESKITPADAKQQYWDELDLQYANSLGYPDDDFEWEDWEQKFIDSLLGI